MQLNAFGGELLLRVLEDVIIEDDKGVVDLGTGGADGLDKAQLAAAVGRLRRRPDARKPCVLGLALDTSESRGGGVMFLDQNLATIGPHQPGT